MSFLSPFPNVIRMSMSATWLWNYLPIECFLLTYDPNRRIKQTPPFICWFFMGRFFVCFDLFVLLLVTPYLIVAVQPCMSVIIYIFIIYIYIEIFRIVLCISYIFLLVFQPQDSSWLQNSDDVRVLVKEIETTRKFLSQAKSFRYVKVSC